jgi:hypothetical protein
VIAERVEEERGEGWWSGLFLLQSIFFEPGAAG